MLTTRPGSSVGRAPPWIGVVPGSIPGQVTFGSQQECVVAPTLCTSVCTSSNSCVDRFFEDGNGLACIFC